MKSDTFIIQILFCFFDDIVFFNSGIGIINFTQTHRKFPRHFRKKFSCNMINFLHVLFIFLKHRGAQFGIFWYIRIYETWKIKEKAKNIIHSFKKNPPKKKSKTSHNREKI